ncbi:MAG: hypothetical protein IJU52_03250 [Clostridia bacterium]|nr:hypothetical protein [Clostridia bacterium]
MGKDTMTGTERIAGFFDAGTFAELGAYRKRADGTPVGVVCGYGAVNGRLVYAFAQDSDCRKGAFDALQAEKIASLYTLAIGNGAPVIALFDSAGAYVADGSTALAAYGTLLAQVSRASGVIPQIAVIGGTCVGMSATAAAMCDFAVTIRDRSRLSVNAPFLVGKEIGTAEYTAGTGLSSVCAADEAEAVAAVRRLIGLLPANAGEGTVTETPSDDVNRSSALGGSVRETVASVTDAESFLEIGAGYADAMMTGFGQVGGVTCGIVANDPETDDGAITAAGARKAAKFIRFCDCFGIPVLTFVDSTGVAISPVEESDPLAAALGRLAMTYASAETAKVTVILGKAHGAAFTLMGSRALGADTVYALPEAQISVMAPEAAVAFLWNDRISETVSRASLVDEWTRTVASAEAAARDGSIDDVIAPDELRRRICAAVYMLADKDPGGVRRRHCDLPL